MNLSHQREMQDTTDNIIISHLRRDTGSDDRWIIQSNEEHSAGVAVLAGKFGEPFGSSDWCRCAGLLHDKGKEQSGFQKYIRRKSGYEAASGHTSKCPHAFVGSLLADSAGLVPLAPVIAGHHAGLPDDVDLKDILSRPVPDGISINSGLPCPSLPPIKEEQQYSHWIRMMFSSLVDADYLDTEKFMQPETAAMRFKKTGLPDLLPRLEEYLANLKSNSRPSPVNEIRANIQERCREMSSGQPGFYSLTVPTGGGKTLSSLVWAIRHAVRYGKKRIIIAIPYTSIILQTAAILRDIFGEENVLEHHSEIDYNEDDSDTTRTGMRLATENWDYPVIVTTNVRLFESMFAARPGKCRKLHNICDSVIILDEIQTLPIAFLQPIVDALQVYKSIFGASVLFTTASMPAIGKDELYETRMLQARGNAFKGIPGITEIIPESWNLHEKLRRVLIETYDRTVLSAEQVAEQMCRHQKVLCIVNTRRHAKDVFDALPKEGITLHLSKNMHSKHIKHVLRQIAEALSDDDQAVVRVVATQLVEAGVDLDFPYVMREQIGLDSIIQAAGRCNREGRLDEGVCSVFSMGDVPRGYMTQCNNARQNMSLTDDLQSPAAMRDYFGKLYFHQDFDVHHIGDDLNNPLEINFRTAAENFKLIDDSDQVNVVIACQDTLQAIQRLESGFASQADFRTLSAYSIGLNMNSKLLGELRENRQLTELAQGLYGTPEHNYDPLTGLFCNSDIINNAIII